jgi:hypothetical protein
MIYLVINFSIVFLFGCLFGIIEIFQRYTSLKYNFKIPEAYIYIIFNGIIAIVALLVIRNFKFCPENILNFNCNIDIIELLWAGFSGMLILRSSIFSIRTDKYGTIGIGLAPIFQIILDRAERRMRNHAAALRFEKINEIMKDVDFSLAIYGLHVICSEFIDNFSDDEKTNLYYQVDNIIKMEISYEAKSLLLGRIIASYCDEEILKVAVEKYKRQNNETEISSRIKVLVN